VEYYNYIYGHELNEPITRATYDPIGGRFRTIKMDGKSLKDDFDAGIRHADSPRGQSTSTSSTADNTTPKRPRDGCAKEVTASTPTPRKEKLIRG